MIYKRKIKRSICVLSDTHTGSDVALWPKHHMLPKGNYITLSHGQEQLYEYWQDFCSMVKEYKCDTVIHLGDAVEGLNRKDGGEGLVVSNIDTQKDACIALLDGVIYDRNKVNLLIVDGSKYHESQDSKIHKAIADAYPKGKYCGVLQNIKLNDTELRMNIAHGSGGSAIYRSTKMDREEMFFLLAQACNKLPEKPDIIMRGHLHYMKEVVSENTLSIQVPCWKAWEDSRFFTANYARMQPDIGGYILLIDEFDEVIIKRKKFPLPHIADRFRAL